MARAAFRSAGIAVFAICILLPASQARGQRAGVRQGGAVVPAKQEKVAWFGTLESARTEAERTNRPILLLAARPECRGVPGFW